MTRNVFVLSLAGLLILLHSPVFAVTFADGGVHTIDAANSFPLEQATVMDGPGGATTILNVVPGGVVDGIEAFGSSVVNVTGGNIGDQVQANDAALMNLSGGTGEWIRMFDDTSVEISGGTWAFIDCSGCAGVRMLSGSVDDLGMEGTTAHLSGGSIGAGFVRLGTVASVSGGTFGLLTVEYMSTAGVTGGTITSLLKVTNDGVATVAGGDCSGDVLAEDDGRLIVTDGDFTGGIVQASGRARITVFGGQLVSDLVASAEGTITLAGSDFSLSIGDIVALSGSVSGLFASGDAFLLNFTRASTARIVLAPPVDTDMDGVLDEVDNCPMTPNASQDDTDADGVGDACNDAEDTDGDEHADALDNCPLVSNPAQPDNDGDGIGDDCDPFPNDPDNEQAQCDEDLATCLDGSALAQCLDDISTCSGDLSQCRTDEAQCQTDEAQCQTDLTVCQSDPLSQDADGDGVRDGLDACGTTPGAVVIDSTGCSHDEFCGQIDLAADRRNRKVCKKADWMNDEPIMRSRDRDCEPTRDKTACVPATP